MKRDVKPSEPMQATVLIVDDVPANRELLRQTLEPRGCEILLAPDGESALKAAQRARPDLILLDVMMPGLSGYETCRRLKSNETTGAIPIIFITAQHETTGVLEGFRAGGVDYITKPFQAGEVLARVETHLRISRLTRELAARNQRRLHRREETWSSRDEERVVVLRERLSLGNHRLRPCRSVQRRVTGDTRGDNSRQVLNLIEQLLIEGRQPGIAIALLLSIDIHQEDTFPPETRIDIQKVL